MGSRTPRPRVVCPGCSQIHEQVGPSTVCSACQRREDDREHRQRVLGGRSGIRARGDFDAVFADPRSPFARAFRQSFFRPDPLAPDGFEQFAAKLRDLYADAIATANERAARRYDEGWRAGFEAGEAAAARGEAA